MHDLLSGVVRIHDVSPSNITKIFALSELFHRFTDLQKKDKQSLVRVHSKRVIMRCLVLLCIVCFCLKWCAHPSHGLKWNMGPCPRGIGIAFQPMDYCMCLLYCKRCLGCKQVRMPLNSETQEVEEKVSTIRMLSKPGIVMCCSGRVALRYV